MYMIKIMKVLIYEYGIDKYSDNSFLTILYE